MSFNQAWKIVQKYNQLVAVHGLEAGDLYIDQIGQAKFDEAAAIVLK